MAKQWSTPPAMQIDPSKNYRARMETDNGTMVIELFADKTPVTVNNFVFLAREGYYENVIFHRVIGNFMVQGGDPTGTCLLYTSSSRCRRQKPRRQPPTIENRNFSRKVHVS